MFRTDTEMMLQTTTSVSSNFDDYTALSVVSVEQYKLEISYCGLVEYLACTPECAE